MAKNLGNILRNLRESYGYKQYDISKYLSLSNQAYSNYETGTRTPDVSTLLRLAQFYNVDFYLLIATLIPADFDYSNYNVKSDTFNMYKNLSDIDFEMLHNFRKLSSHDQEDILEFTKIKAVRNNSK